MKKEIISGKIGCIPFSKEEELVKFLNDKISSGTGFYSIAINAEKLIRANEDKNFSKIVEDSIFPIPDGIAATLLLKKKGFQSKKIDLPEFIVRYCADNSLKLALVGATSKSNTLACENLVKKNKDLDIVLGLDGYKNEKNIISEITECRPDIVLLGLGSPKQEFLAKKLHQTFPNLVIINCGGAIDVFSGLVKRAPVLIQNLNIEWLYRLIIQPTRIRRYLKLFKFLPIYFKS